MVLEEIVFFSFFFLFFFEVPRLFCCCEGVSCRQKKHFVCGTCILQLEEGRSDTQLFPTSRQGFRISIQIRSLMHVWVAVVLTCVLVTTASAIDNGLGKTPPMGTHDLVMHNVMHLLCI